MVIRTAAPDDIPRIVDLLNAAFSMEWDFISRDRASVPEITHYFETGRFHVIDAGSGVLDACMYLEQRVDHMYLGMLAVSPSRQRGGVGRRMIAAAEELAIAAGCRALDIRIVDRRIELPPFYRRLGFVETGTQAFEDPQLTKPCHFILMSKELSGDVPKYQNAV